ncbi:alpha/beta hydrolase family protein [Paenibacillus chartarius]|uniref:Alpha/beta hydrolase family protein n=1 Tax=Paenibacillus chartarius TaxID=747481 RepID=A0ABV6DPS4_9BACL
MWNPDAYIEQLYKNETRRLSFQAASASEWQAWRKELLARFKESLGAFHDVGFTGEARIVETVDCGDYVRERLELRTAESLLMPTYLLIPKRQGNAGRKPPLVVACHGHGYGSKAAVGLLPDGQDSGDDPNVHHKFGVSLVQRGFAVIVPELIGFGDRKLEHEPIVNRDTNSCFPIGAFLLMIGKSIAGLRIQETIAAIDYACGRDDIDSSRIGIYGLSGGGLIAAYTAALDERIRAAVISCYTNTFRDSILDRRHCLDNYIPHILAYAEMPDLIGLIAPRPLFVEAGVNDHLFPLHGTKQALEVLERVYLAAGVPERLSSVLFPGGHEVCGEQSYPWLERMLDLQ